MILRNGLPGPPRPEEDANHVSYESRWVGKAGI